MHSIIPQSRKMDGHIEDTFTDVFIVVDIKEQGYTFTWIIHSAKHARITINQRYYQRYFYHYQGFDYHYQGFDYYKSAFNWTTKVIFNCFWIKKVRPRTQVRYDEGSNELVLLRTIIQGSTKACNPCSTYIAAKD